jgi:putative membrane protein
MTVFWNLLIALIVAAVVILIVGRLNLGMSVSGFGAAFIAAIVISVVTAVVVWLLGALGITIGGGILGTIVFLLVAGAVLNFSGRFVPGMSVNGCTGGAIAAVAMAVVYWLLVWLLGLIGITI